MNVIFAILIEDPNPQPQLHPHHVWRSGEPPLDDVRVPEAAHCVGRFAVVDQALVSCRVADDGVRLVLPAVPRAGGAPLAPAVPMKDLAILHYIKKYLEWER